jgi:hypothetical protein
MHEILASKQQEQQTRSAAEAWIRRHFLHFAHHLRLRLLDWSLLQKHDASSGSEQDALERSRLRFQNHARNKAQFGLLYRLGLLL